MPQNEHVLAFSFIQTHSKSETLHQVKMLITLTNKQPAKKKQPFQKKLTKQQGKKTKRRSDRTMSRDEALSAANSRQTKECDTLSVQQGWEEEQERRKSC